MTDMHQSIKNLEFLRDALEKAANKSENKDFSLYLEQISWEMQKYANEIRGLQNLFKNECELF